MKRTTIITALMLMLGSQTFSQEKQANDPTINKRGCGTTVPSEEWDTWFNKLVDEYKEQKTNGKSPAANYVIPVIVHVIHGGQNVGTFPNVTQAQINSQIAVLNADFAGTGLNVNQLAATAFSAVGIANTNITFCLAQLDPNGVPLPEPGIDRINYLSKGWPNPTSQGTSAGFQSLMNSTIKPASIWNPIRYFNIWISDVNQGTQLLGFATFPANGGLIGLSGFGSATNDGIWVWTRAFGNVGAVNFPYNRGRTATHEAGHWLGLRHIGGDGNGNPNGDCNATDFCNDTPPQEGGFSGGQFGQNFGAPTYPLHLGTCTLSANGDMFMNFMDYVDDASCYMFTPDQDARIQTAMLNGTYRKQLTASSATMCNLAAQAPTAAFAAVDSICIDSLILLSNQTTGIPGPTYTWSTNPPLGSTFSPGIANANPTLSFNIPGQYTITVVATNSVGTNTTSLPIKVIDCGNLEGLPKNSLFSRMIAIMPNPSSGVVHIQSKLPNLKGLSVEIYNYLGDKVYADHYTTVEKQGVKLDLGNLSKGVYTILLSNGSDWAVKRLVLE